MSDHPKKLYIMKPVVFFLLIFLSLQGFSQEASLQETAKRYMKQGDYKNAVVVLNRAVQEDPENAELMKDLAFALYLQKDYAKAQEVIDPLLDKKEADVQTYQIAAMIYKGRDDIGETEKLYKKGLRKFPESGVLYSEYGEVLWFKKDFTAIKQWEKGIQADPNFSGNYYNAAKYYYLTLDKVWSIVYGEIFVNLESYSRRTVEIKNVLLDSYKKLFTDSDVLKNYNTKNEFSIAYLNIVNRQSSLASMGITPESLTMIRTRFLLDWDEKYGAKYPFRLFDHHRQLLREGMFDAYNQWLFGPVFNLTSFQNWTNNNADAYKQFTVFHRGRIFKMPENQNYQGK
jgi:tetratricopeptide (TPR) repeat protein